MMNMIMKYSAAILIILLSGLKNTHAAVSPHPNIMWKSGGAFETNRIEIASDAAFEKIVDQDTIHNLSRYVPAKELKPGIYHWRSGEQGGSFEVDAPKTEIVISAGSGMTEIRAALKQAAERPFTLIRFEKGTYALHPGQFDTVFDVEHTDNLIIDGGGAKFVIHDIARLIRVRFSKHITFRNFRVDYDGMLYTAAKVESIAKDGTMDLSLWPGCVPPENVEHFMEEKRGLFLDPEYPRMAENVPLLVYMEEAWMPLGTNRYRLKATVPSRVQNVKPGHVYVCAPRYKVQGIELYNSEDITLADVTTWYLPGIGVVTSFANDLKLIRLKMLRREDRLLGLQNGGTNIHNARIGPWVEGCRFENTGDDNNHISALVLTPVEQPKPDVVVICPQQPGTHVFSSDMDIRPGDRLALFDRLRGQTLAEGVVLKVRMQGKNTAVTLDREIPQITLGSGRESFPKLNVTQVYNLSRACGHFAFRNNEFVRGRRIGILAKSGPGLIENNQFIELGGGGVEIWNAPFEGLHAHGILIRNNLFRRCGLNDNFKQAPPAIWTEIFAGKPSRLRHRDLRIVGNEIFDYPGHAMKIVDVDGVVIEGNRMEITDPAVVRTPGVDAVSLDNVVNSTVENNTVVKPTPGSDAVE